MKVGRNQNIILELGNVERMSTLERSKEDEDGIGERCLDVRSLENRGSQKWMLYFGGPWQPRERTPKPDRRPYKYQIPPW